MKLVENVIVGESKSIIVPVKVLSKPYDVFKRVMDIIVGIIGTILIIPTTIIIYIANMLLGDNGPVFYRQKRIGKEGKIFYMLKYRSMVIGADKKLKECIEKDDGLKMEYEKYKKLKKDPRITKIGNFLRKTSLDELLQFIHLIDGKMSLIGPRPFLETEREDMGVYYNTIIQCKPGITRIVGS